MRLAWLAVIVISSSALAKESSKVQVKCTLDQSKDDLVFTGGNATVPAGKVAKRVVVIDGNLVVQKGAKVETVLVSNGNATIEAGARVEGSVVVIGGKSTVQRRSDVKKSIIAVDDVLHVDSEDGVELDLRLSVDGKSIADRIVEDAVKEIRGCALARR